MKFLFVCVMLAAGMCSAQSTQLPSNVDEMKYLRFVLLNVASLDNSPAAIQSYEDHLVKLHGLNAQESAAIRTAAQALKPLLAELRQSARTVSIPDRVLSAADIAVLQDMETRRDQKLAELAGQILNGVRPETAARLRAPGRIVAEQKKEK